MKALVWVGMIVVLSLPLAASAQPGTSGTGHLMEDAVPESQQGDWSATVAVHQDAFFGFYPTLAAGFGIADGVDLTFYSILWTTPSFSFNSGGGGLWTEVGTGVSLALLDGAVSINPQLGVLNGSVLSGSERPLAAEGIVPNLTASYDGDYAESELYFGYYVALRGDRQNDFIHYWASAGFKPLAFASSGPLGSLLSFGVHWEHLRLQRTRGGNATDIYKWIGPYARMTLPNDVFLRFGAGWDLEDGEAADFYKASVGMSF